MSRVVAFLRQQGGYCTRGAAVAATSRAEVEQALAAGAIVWIARGRYGLPGLDLAVATAHGMNGVLSHVSAARWHGWEVKRTGRTDVTLPTRRHAGVAAPQVRIHRSDLTPDEVVEGIATSPERTLLDCLRSLPFDEALTIADSALRHDVRRAVLLRVGQLVRGRGRPQVLRVVRSADRRAANPFESCLRAIALGVPGLRAVPQQTVKGLRQTVRPDLVDMALRIVLEADSFEWHGSRSRLHHDAVRYNWLTVEGWMVLRFSYEQVMYRPADVRAVLRAAVNARGQVPPRPGCAA